ncbi:hypothetical protein RR48_01537 [Papilio machaon]|uniref:Peptidase M12A domain-containing protein n=1 Tax=Papilio machaon TaxID=76193 RepID=A0A0N1PIX1_PAPMA|nr:hypothetical protein RR48_01537 [Papilio machaon]
MELFAKNGKLPQELRPLQYDVNSVTHFGEREFSKNGHRTIIFKDNTIRQNRNGLSDTDIRKIEIIYGPECQKRDRQEKIDQCQNYPGVARRKRDIDLSAIGPSLRVNRDITAPPINITDVKSSLDHLGIENEVKEILEKVYTVISLALKNARSKYCNKTNDLRSKTTETSDVLGMVELVTEYAKSIAGHAVENKTEFCEASNSIDQYHVARCNHFTGNQCKMIKSTKFGNINYSTNHRPQYPFSTNLYRDLSKYEKSKFRNGNETIEGIKNVRRKRALGTTEKMHLNKKDITMKETKTSTSTMNTTKTIRGQTKNVDTKSTKTEKEIIKDSTADIRRRFGDFRAKDKRKLQEKPEAKAAPKTVQLSKDNLEFYSERRWPNNVVPYYIKNSLKYYDLDKVRQRLNEVNHILKTETCVHIKEISEKDVGKYQDYLILDQSPDFVTGRVGGKQVSIVYQINPNKLPQNKTSSN